MNAITDPWLQAAAGFAVLPVLFTVLAIGYSSGARDARSGTVDIRLAWVASGIFALVALVYAAVGVLRIAVAA